ncbi:MAG: lysophospholipid acyltransferase family protein [Prevotellaceae bacterium]|jgi:1-acyl-sn-glycerol-3-phosphate acyltransferase|nr:lysophospholipid acyltransferase family protein [Prevotellaceae bacterium]
MKQSIYRFLYYRLLGWKTNVTLPNIPKCVICVAPHTSNWDLFYGKVFYNAIGRDTCFMMKKEWFFFPVGSFFRAIGGIPVNRDRKTSMVDQMAALFERRKQFHLAITPEGTRKANPDWKKGFYYIALKAGVPIYLYAIDYVSKTITATHSIHPSGDIDKDMGEIKRYYQDFHGKHPRNFTI